MPIFLQQLKNVENMTPQDAVKVMAGHLRYIQEQLEYTLVNLDSDNIREIETDKTDINSPGGVDISGSSISMNGNSGEAFFVGTKDGRFQFKLNGKGGGQVIYLNSDGELIVTKQAAVNIDCGEW